MKSVSFATKIFWSLSSLVAVVLLLAGTVAWTVSQQKSEIASLEHSIIGTANVERANALLYAIVMDSRGVYMAETPERMDQFSKGMEKFIAEFDTLVADWEETIHPDDSALLAQFKEQWAEQRRVRTALIDAGRREGNVAAAVIGDNPANRVNRQALNESIAALAESYQNRTLAIQHRAEDQATTAMILVLAFGAVAVGLFGFIVLLVRRSVVRPLDAIINALERLAEGDIEADVVVDANRNDEIGRMGRAFQSFRASLIERARLASDDEKNSAQRIARQENIDRLIGEFETAVTGALAIVAESSGRMDTAAVTLGAIADDAANQAGSAGEVSMSASNNVSTVASASEELASSISEIARQISRQAEVVGRASDLATESDRRITTLDDAARKIGEVVGLIQAIAEQTNLLALNATIEAARAGEAGKGFAVVAQEVKNLASQTAKATEEISNQISAIQSSTQNAVGAMKQISSTMEEARSYTVSISAAIEQQGAATQEISRNTQEAAQGTNQLSATVDGVAQSIAETRRSATEVSRASADLGAQAKNVQEAVGHFIREVRAA
jgi:methyl-accepting chemotaxis protein